LHNHGRIFHREKETKNEKQFHHTELQVVRLDRNNHIVNRIHQYLEDVGEGKVRIITTIKISFEFFSNHFISTIPYY
jgi:hypothetical protein